MIRRFDVAPRFDLALRPPISLWDHFFGDLAFPRTFADESEWMPAADISETDSHYHVSMELPGIDMKEMDITYAEGFLTVKGTKTKTTDIGESCYCTERFTGSFQRSFRIPGSVDTDKIDASYRDGILRVSLPKTEESKVKKIEVH